jgi:hypothetical protein
MILPLWLALAAAPTGPNVTPFRTDVTPRVDPVFGDVNTLRRSVDRFLSLYTEMEQVRTEFSGAVHGTLAQLAPPGGVTARRCPTSALAQYARALSAGGRYLGLGRQLEARYREIRRADELGDAAGLTPDYRWKVKRARELYLELLRDYREMRVAFYDQLGAEMRHAGCNTAAFSRVKGGKKNADTPDPSDPASWAIDEDAPEAAPETGGAEPPTPAGTKAPKPAPLPAAAVAIWIEIDNSHCSQPSQLTVDGAVLGTVNGQKKLSVRTRSGPHEICVLPIGDKRTCGEPATVRRAYLYEGWTLVVRCDGK